MACPREELIIRSIETTNDSSYTLATVEPNYYFPWLVKCDNKPQDSLAYGLKWEEVHLPEGIDETLPLTEIFRKLLENIDETI